MEDEELAQVSAQSARIVNELRSWGANYTEFTRRFANYLGLHSTDAAALVEILYAEDQNAPLSLARLSERVSLTSGATTALVDRLEKAGHIVRTRGEHTDRRVVTLRSSPAIGKPASEFFQPFSDRLTAMMAQYPPELIEQFEEFLTDMRATLTSLLDDEYRETRGRERA
ncbi:MarR family winged helix-turn-helix transcriptional regulator [Streptomyces purpureus]|uniref:MarR family transcriptional regulator n=1 Tax=Streptomyces purpureus TaxID=1951 RepID=A0A918GXY9_9ACTN|nr:MarR family transcriptional regulator [Streptomyces purpureus]GGT19318.1 MarR family transcriptional regulator [Streptomyces purpureus]